jgi:hypothetical protein
MYIYKLIYIYITFLLINYILYIICIIIVTRQHSFVLSTLALLVQLLIEILGEGTLQVILVVLVLAFTTYGLIRLRTIDIDSSPTGFDLYCLLVLAIYL